MLWKTPSTQRDEVEENLDAQVDSPHRGFSTILDFPESDEPSDDHDSRWHHMELENPHTELSWPRGIMRDLKKKKQKTDSVSGHNKLQWNWFVTQQYAAYLKIWPKIDTSSTNPCFSGWPCLYFIKRERGSKRKVSLTVKLRIPLP